MSKGSNKRKHIKNKMLATQKRDVSKVQHIPSKQKTIKLLYLDTKNKICKPMQQ